MNSNASHQLVADIINLNVDLLMSWITLWSRDVGMLNAKILFIAPSNDGYKRDTKMENRLNTGNG